MIVVYKGRRYNLYRGGIVFCLGGGYISVEIFGPMGDMIFQGGGGSIFHCLTHNLPGGPHISVLT